MSSTVGSERVTAVVGDVLSALHEVLERHRVTEEEWMASVRQHFKGKVIAGRDLMEI